MMSDFAKQLQHLQIRILVFDDLHQQCVSPHMFRTLLSPFVAHEVKKVQCVTCVSPRF